MSRTKDEALRKYLAKIERERKLKEKQDADKPKENRK